MIEIFISKNSISQTSTAAKTIQTLTSSLETTLLVIDKRLTRMKQQKIKTTNLKKTQSYAQTAAASHQRAALSQSASSKRIFKSKSSKKTLLESRKIKKLMIQIIDSKKKEKLMMKFIKNLTDSLQEKCDEIMRINRLVSENIRVFIRFAKIKNDLQKDAE